MWYFVIQKPIGAISRNIKIYHFFLLLLVSDHFKHIVPFCVCVYPLKQHETEYFSVKPVKIWDYVLGKTIWNQVLLSETSGKSRLCFGKMIWNWVFLSETGGKSRLCFGKMIWNKVFNIEKSWFMTVFFQFFIKKRILITNINCYFLENCHVHIVSYLIILYQYRIVSFRYLVPILQSCPCLLTNASAFL